MARKRPVVELEKLASLTGVRLSLRRPQSNDVAAVYHYAHDTEVTRFLAWPRHNSPDDSEHFLQVAAEGWRNGDYLVWIIEDKRGVVGAIGAELSNTNAGIGYVLARECWGKGYATEALGVVCSALFQYSPVKSIWAFCVAENPASQRVLEKSGFDFVRTYSNYFSCPNLENALKDVRLYRRDMTASDARA